MFNNLSNFLPSRNVLIDSTLSKLTIVIAIYNWVQLFTTTTIVVTELTLHYGQENGK